MIDAQKWFKASVIACLFSVEVGADKPCYQADVYSDLYTNEPQSTIGIIGEQLVADVKAYEHSAFIEGVSSWNWRQGLKLLTK